MLLTSKQIEEFQVAAQPLMTWLAANGHPHVQAIVDSTRAECVEGLCAVLTAETSARPDA